MWFSVDGITWDIPCDIDRAPDVRKSDISGMMLDGNIYNDYVGTYMAYSVRFIPRPDRMADYYSLYELLTAPRDHAFMFPYNGAVVSFTGSVEAPRDVYRAFPSGEKVWIGNQFAVNAATPTKLVDLAEIISHGMPATPEGMPAQEGDTYRYTGGAWLPVSYVNGDEIYW